MTKRIASLYAVGGEAENLVTTYYYWSSCETGSLLVRKNMPVESSSDPTHQIADIGAARHLAIYVSTF